MTASLWSFEALVRLCRQRDPDVQGWAADWAGRLYPEQAGPLMAGILRDGDRSVVAQAADFFGAHPDQSVADALLASFRKSSGVPAERLAHALVQLKDGRLLGAAREKHATKSFDPLEFAGVLLNVALLGTDESRRYVESALERLDAFGDFKEMAAGPVFGANIAAGTDMGKLLLFAYRSGVSGYIAALLAEIANRAGAWCTAEALALKDGKERISKPLAEEVEESIALLAESGYGGVGKSLTTLLRKRRFDEVLHETYETALAIQQAKRSERGEQAFLRWQTGKEAPFFHCDSLAALEATAAESPAAQRGKAAVITVIVLARLAESRSLIAMIPEVLGHSAAFQLFSEDRPDAAQDDALLDLLAVGADAKALAQEAIRLADLSPFSRANGRLIRFAARFIDEGLARELLALDFGGSGFEEDVAEALARPGARSVPLLRPLFEKNDPDRIPLALRVLEGLPTEASVDIILAHWSLLWNEHKDLLLEAVEAIGDRRFIPGLKTELKEGERDEGAQHYQQRFAQLLNHLSKFSTRKIRDIRTYNRRGIQPVYVENGEYAVVNSQHLGPKHINYDGLQKTSAHAFSACAEAHIRPDDLLIYTTGAYIGRTNAYLSDTPAFASNHVNILRLNPDIDHAYMALVFQSIIGQFQTQKHARGSAQAELYPADIDKFIVPLLPPDRQKAIGNLVRQSLDKKRGSTRLLDQAKARVEQLIEEAVKS